MPKLTFFFGPTIQTTIMLQQCNDDDNNISKALWKFDTYDIDMQYRTFRLDTTFT